MAPEYCEHNKTQELLGYWNDGNNGGWCPQSSGGGVCSSQMDFRRIETDRDGLEINGMKYLNWRPAEKEHGDQLYLHVTGKSNKLPLHQDIVLQREEGEEKNTPMRLNFELT